MAMFLHTNLQYICRFNASLTEDIVSFEQQGPDAYLCLQSKVVQQGFIG